MPQITPKKPGWFRLSDFLHSDGSFRSRTQLLFDGSKKVLRQEWLLQNALLLMCFGKPVRRVTSDEDEFRVARQQDICEIETRGLSQASVQQSQIRRFASNEAECIVRRRRRTNHTVAIIFEHLLQIAGNQRFVFDDEHASV